MYGFTFLEDLSLFCRRLFDLKTYSLHMEQLTWLLNIGAICHLQPTNR